jgi:hypothetical protein
MGEKINAWRFLLGFGILRHIQKDDHKMVFEEIGREGVDRVNLA